MERPVLSIHDLYEAFIGEKNSLYYLAKFEEFDQRGGLLVPSWNWAAFFCSWGWLIYRRMYGLSFGFVFLLIIFGVMSSAVRDYGNHGLAVLISIAPFVLFAAVANSIYHQRAKSKIEYAANRLSDERRAIEYVRQSGGANQTAAWVIASIPVVGIAAALIIPALSKAPVAPTQAAKTPPPLLSEAEVFGKAKTVHQAPIANSAPVPDAMFHQEVGAAIARYPFLDINSPHKNDQAIADVRAIRDQLIAEGRQPHEALKTAADYVGQRVLGQQGR